MRIACSHHTPIFRDTIFSITPHFPQISALCYQACELVIPDIMQRGASALSSSPLEATHISYMQVMPKPQLRAIEPFPPVRRTRASDHKATAPPLHHSPRNVHPPPHFVIPPHPNNRHTPAVLINAPRKLVDPTTAVRIPRRGGLSAKQFLRYVEDNYFTLRNTSFWAMYKGVNNERGFNDVNPCVASFPRATDYAHGRNVLFQWHNDLLYGVYEMNDEYREVMVAK